MKRALAHEIIKEMRLKKQISQKALAESVGLTQQAIALLENGKRKMEFDLFIKLLNAMEATPLEISEAITLASHNMINSSVENEDIEKEQRVQEYKSILMNTLVDLSYDEQLKLIKSFLKLIDYITRIPSSNEFRSKITFNIHDLLVYYAGMLMNGIELSMGTTSRNEDYLLLLKNYDNTIRLIGEYKDSIIQLAISLSNNDEKLIEFLEKNN